MNSQGTVSYNGQIAKVGTIFEYLHIHACLYYVNIPVVFQANENHINEQTIKKIDMI